MGRTHGECSGQNACCIPAVTSVQFRWTNCMLHTCGGVFRRTKCKFYTVLVQAAKILSGGQNACYIPVLVQADTILSGGQNACYVLVLGECGGRRDGRRERREGWWCWTLRECRVQPSVHSPQPQTVILDSGMNTCLRASAICVYAYGVIAGTGVGIGGLACVGVCLRVCVCVCVCVRAHVTASACVLSVCACVPL